MNQAYRRHASDYTKNCWRSWFKTRQRTSQVECQFESLERYLYRLQILYAPQEGGLLSCFLINLFELFEELFDASALENSNVYLLSKAFNCLTVRYTPKVRRKNNKNIICVPINSGWVDCKTLVKMTGAGGDLMILGLSFVITSVGGLSKGIIR